MVELLIEFKAILLPFLVDIGAVLVISFTSLAFVYIVGRMLEITESFRIKNCIALVVIIGLSYGYVVFKKQEIDIYNVIWQVLSYSCFSVLLYVLVGFRLYDRIDNWFDKKGLKDKPFNPKKRKKK